MMQSIKSTHLPKFKTDEDKQLFFKKTILDMYNYIKSQPNLDEDDYPDITLAFFKEVTDQEFIIQVAQCDNDALDFIWDNAITRIESVDALIDLIPKLRGLDDGFGDDERLHTLAMQVLTHKLPQI